MARLRSDGKGGTENAEESEEDEKRESSAKAQNFPGSFSRSSDRLQVREISTETRPEDELSPKFTSLAAFRSSLAPRSFHNET